MELTVGELRRELEGVPDNTKVLIENLEDRLYFKNNYECATLPCDEQQATCLSISQNDTHACDRCYLAHSYSHATRVIKHNNRVYIDTSI